MSRQSTRQRQRSVILTPEARELLEAAIDRQWQDERAPGLRLNRERRARYMDVGAATSDKILRGSHGVDRASLEWAFKSLGLEWKEEYAVRPSTKASDPREEDADDSGSSEDSIPEPEPLVPRNRTRSLSRGRATVVMALVLSAGLLIGGGTHRFSPTMSDEDRQNALLWEANRLYHAARPDEARAKLDELLYIGKGSNTYPNASAVQLLLGDIAWNLGDLQEASFQYQSALDYRRSVGDGPWPPLLQSAALAAAEVGDFATANRHLDLALRTYEKAGDPNGVGLVLRDQGTVAAREGDHRRALALLWRSLEKLTPLEKPDAVADVRGQMGLAQVRTGNPEDGLENLRVALIYWTWRRHPRWIAVSQWRLAQALIVLGEEEEARTLIATARAAFVSLRADGMVKRLDGAFARG